MAIYTVHEPPLKKNDGKYGLVAFLLLLLAGGLCYTLGCAFYIWRRLPYHHAIWHVFVMAGSTLHFFAVFFYVIPIQS